MFGGCVPENDGLSLGYGDDELGGVTKVRDGGSEGAGAAGPLSSSRVPQYLQVTSPGSALPPQVGHSIRSSCWVNAGSETSWVRSSSQKFSLSG